MFKELEFLQDNMIPGHACREQGRRMGCQQALVVSGVEMLWMS